MKKLISLCLSAALLVLALISFTACKPSESTDKDIKTRQISYVYFNTESLISTYGEVSEERFESYVTAADELLCYYHELFDIYYEYSGKSNLRTVNKNAGKAPVKVDAELIDFLEYCKELFTLTKGKTNVMMGAVLRIWHKEREIWDTNPSLAGVPSDEELRAALQHTDIDSLVIDREAGTVYISDSEASLDVGAIGKGYATEKLAERLKEMGADSVALNIGGNLRTLGKLPNGRDWKVGITNPDRGNPDFPAKVSFGESSCVTSGNYERFYIVDGVSYHHIIDPDTLHPANYFASVTVITEDSGLADALSTALFCLDYTEGKALIDSLDVEVGVIYITDDGTVTHYGNVTVVTD